MNVLEQSAVDRQLITLLDSLRKSSALVMGERNWYDARRESIDRIGQTAEPLDGAASKTQVLSRTERKAIERILDAHQVDHPSIGR